MSKLKNFNFFVYNFCHSTFMVCNILEGWQKKFILKTRERKFDFLKSRETFSFWTCPILWCLCYYCNISLWLILKWFFLVCYFFLNSSAQSFYFSHFFIINKASLCFSFSKIDFIAAFVSATLFSCCFKTFSLFQ